MASASETQIDAGAAFTYVPQYERQPGRMCNTEIIIDPGLSNMKDCKRAGEETGNATQHPYAG